MKNIYLYAFLILSLVFVVSLSTVSCQSSKKKAPNSSTKVDKEKERKIRDEEEKKIREEEKKKKRKAKVKFDIIPLAQGVSVTKNDKGFETINITLSTLEGNNVAKKKTYKDFLAKNVLKDVFAIKIKNTDGGLIRMDAAEPNKEYTNFSHFTTPVTVCNDDQGFCNETEEWEINRTPAEGIVKLRKGKYTTISAIWITRGFGAASVQGHEYLPALVCYNYLTDHITRYADGLSNAELLVLASNPLSFKGGEVLTCKIGFWSNNPNAQKIPKKWIDLAKDGVFFDVYFVGLEMGNFVTNVANLTTLLDWKFLEVTAGANDQKFQEETLQKISKLEGFRTFIKKARIKLVDQLSECHLPENSIILEGN